MPSKPCAPLVAHTAGIDGGLFRVRNVLRARVEVRRPVLKRLGDCRAPRCRTGHLAHEREGIVYALIEDAGVIEPDHRDARFFLNVLRCFRVLVAEDDVWIEHDERFIICNVSRSARAHGDEGAKEVRV